MSPSRHVLLSSMKDEGPFVLEFVAHHLVLGFDAIHIASNDCSDGTDLLLDALAAGGAITHTRNEVKPGEIPQHRAYQRLRRRQPVDEADWVMVLDVDEFLFVPHGASRVADLTALADEGIDVISLSALNFGTSEAEEWQPGRVTRQFDLRLPAQSEANRPVKSLSRGQGRWGGLHNHHPVDFRGPGAARYLLGSGKTGEVPQGARMWHHLRRLKPEDVGHELGWYNHYPIKSLESYMLRRQRGRGARPAGDPQTRHDEAYWARFAAADIPDRRLNDRYGAATEAQMASLLALPGVAEAQARTEALTRQRLQALFRELDG